MDFEHYLLTLLTRQIQHNHFIWHTNRKHPKETMHNYLPFMYLQYTEEAPYTGTQQGKHFLTIWRKTSLTSSTPYCFETFRTSLLVKHQFQFDPPPLFFLVYYHNLLVNIKYRSHITGPSYQSYDSKVKIIKEAWRTEYMHRFIRLHQTWPLRTAPNCLLHRCPSWRCPAFLRPSQTPWPPPASACSLPSRTSCCSGWSLRRLADGSLGIFSEEGQRDSVSVEITLYY